MKAPSGWSRERIEAFLKSEKLKYQKIELPFGLSTPGQERRSTCGLIFGGSLASKSVLDVGSYLGYFCLEAYKRDAARVVGWDVDPERIRLARIISEIKGARVEYQQYDIEKSEPQETFDVVLCLNLLHHLNDPVAVLDKLIRITREKIVLEVASIGRHDRRKLGLSRLQSRVISKTPCIIAGRGSASEPYDKQQKYFFTKDSIRNLLQYQRHYFSRVDIIDSDFKDRFIVIARKRRIKNLIVVAGPTASGKSTTIKRMLGDELPELALKMGVGSFRKWEHVGASSLRNHEKTDIENLLFHYDILRPVGRSAKTHERDEALHILATAQNVSFVTLYAEPHRLCEQLVRGEFNVPHRSACIQIIKMMLRKIFSMYDFRTARRMRIINMLYKKAVRPASKRHMNLLKLYQKPEEVYRLYRTWFSFVDSLPMNVRHNLVLHNNGRMRIFPRTEWGGLRRTEPNRLTGAGTDE